LLFFQIERSIPAWPGSAGGCARSLVKLRLKDKYMIEHTLDPEHSILYLRPKSALERDDFVQLGKMIDPYIENNGKLAGLIIEVTKFPGWESLGAMSAHLRFVRDHHKHIKKIALVTDSALGNVAEHLMSHFVSAEIRHFPAGGLEAAKQWIINSG
jgi:SpoIIAA-like